MYCQSFFSHKEIYGKGKADQHEMLHSIGKNWTTDLSPREKNGTFIFNGNLVDDFIPNFDTINNFVKKSIEQENCCDGKINRENY
jgi:hypothetical protein